MTTCTMFVRHEVADYDAWRAVYDAAADMQKHDGVLSQSVYRGAEDPNDVTVTHEFESLEAAHKFFGSEDLRQAMQHAHVLSTPTVWFTSAT